MKIRIKKMLKKISFMFRYKHVHHYIQEWCKNKRPSSILKNEKNISEHDYTCIHVSYKDNCSNL